jgi:hypothetical protein
MKCGCGVDLGRWVRGGAKKMFGSKRCDIIFASPFFREGKKFLEGDVKKCGE